MRMFIALFTITKNVNNPNANHLVDGWIKHVECESVGNKNEELGISIWRPNHVPNFSTPQDH